MAFQCKTSVILLFLFMSASCVENIEESEPMVRSNLDPAKLPSGEMNCLRSECINWDSIYFTFSHFELTNSEMNCHAVFYSNASARDTLELDFLYMPYDNSGVYYCSNPYSEARINKLSGNKIRSNGEGRISYRPVSKDSAEITIDMLQRTQFRLPDNTYLNARVLGRFMIPREH